ncbi:DUF4270 family protein [Hymenobacter rubidus]|uniref:DUF4270 family protein n=1 Tax=Hymenobacter rubidus TaxID=1441626 RepID=UPI00191F1922|nr:DUF4270 family protein [Hymenobacter rubidus]
MNWLTSRCAPLTALAALALASCDTGTALNVDLPDTTAVNTLYKDLSVDVATVRFAPVRTQKADHFLIGRLADNVAGTTEARAYLNATTGSSNDSLPSKYATPVLDSVVLVMGFDNVNGSTTTPARFDIYNLQAPLDERQTYSSSTTTATTAQPLGLNVTSRLDRTVRVKTDSTATTPTYYTNVLTQTVRLALQRTAAVSAPFAPAPAVASPFFDGFYTSLRGTTTLTQAKLDALINGLAIGPNASYSSAILSFGRTYNARLAFFFHDDAVAAPAPPLRRAWHSYSIFFGPVNSSVGLATASDPRYYTQITNSLSGTPLSALTDLTQAVSASNLLVNGVPTSYLQEGTGLGTRITFQGLEQLTNIPGLTINRAELRVPIKPYSNALFVNPTYIYALEVDARNQILQRTINYLPTDRVVQSDGSDQLSAGSPAAGTIVDGGTTQQYYNLLITSYLDAYLKSKLDGNPASLVLVPATRTSSALSLNRAAIDASTIRLRVYYSSKK